ncbi:hypothetical protein Goklo_023989 [Gossypium klotzschianum]|uniref:Uncharacterized protein n=1 Tax=Gossypium klotzschianum TaxID=34286 RepID=A0A7J8W8N8_9ROSI|nr:hypothetical protein [Gossypium klotzschianum]
MWEDRYDYIPTRELIIVPELACVPEYILWFRIHDKSYLLSAEERQQQLCVQRERRGPLNPRRRDDDASPSTRPRHSPDPSSTPIQSPGPATAPTQSPDPTVQPTIPTAQPFHVMPSAYPSLFMYPSSYMFPFSSPMASWSQWPSSSSFLITPNGPSPLVMQTPPHSLFYQGGSSS